MKKARELVLTPLKSLTESTISLRPLLMASTASTPSAAVLEQNRSADRKVIRLYAIFSDDRVL